GSAAATPKSAGGAMMAGRAGGGPRRAGGRGGRPPAADGRDPDGLGVTQAGLAGPRKAEETLRRCFSGLVDDSGRRLGIAPCHSQKSDLVAFLGNDPLMRGKLLNYLDQVVK